MANGLSSYTCINSNGGWGGGYHHQLQTLDSPLVIPFPAKNTNVISSMIVQNAPPEPRTCSTRIPWYHQNPFNYSDVIMSAMAHEITGSSSVYSTACGGADQRKLRSSASLVFVMGIHRWPVNSPHKGPVTWKIFPFDDLIIYIHTAITSCLYSPYKWHYVIMRVITFETTKSMPHRLWNIMNKFGFK